MSIDTANPEFVKEVCDREDKLPVRNDMCRSQFRLHGGRTEKVILLFHGFTAAPYQFRTLGELLYNSGYNVLVPLMPGHGQAGAWNKDNPSPLPESIEPYQEFALEWLERAEELGDMVIVGGLSGGGCLAAWLAVEHADRVDRAVLFAPYLSNCSLVVDLMVNRLNTYFEWRGGVWDDKRPGYQGFKFPAMRVFPKLGKRVLDQSRDRGGAPMFVISTDTDIAVSNPDHRDLFDQVRSRVGATWYYCFPRELNVPHAMNAPEEGNQWVNVLNVMVKAYIESDVSWDEVETIALRMTEGETCDQIVAALGMGDRVSPDFPTMMTMVDKRAIVMKQPGWTVDE
jgi:pimeloyl-ACP methyl ester carboxylesterase